MPSDNDQLLDAITDLTPKLLTTMEAFEQVQRNLHPSRSEKLAEFILPYQQALQPSVDNFSTMEFPEDLAPFGAQLSQGASYCLRACSGITENSGDSFAAMKAMRAHCRAQESVYTLANIMTPISQYFLELEQRDNRTLLDELNKDRPGQQVGILNSQNDRSQRGGFTLYIPEYLDPDKPASLVIALHGGTGHGADFLWAWLREARSRGFILLAPTSQQDTWSLMGEEHDLQPLTAMLNMIQQQCNVDNDHILLSGISDGATYSLLAGLREDSPFTHLAPFSGVLHPEISFSGNMQYARDKKIYLVHGTLDWMFPIETAYMADSELRAAGADVTFRPIDGLSHTYCRGENPALLNWFNPALALKNSADEH